MWDVLVQVEHNQKGAVSFLMYLHKKMKQNERGYSNMFSILI
jgi:hypothetical protein